MIQQPDSVPIKHPFALQNGGCMDVPWWLFERLVILGYVDLGTAGEAWAVSSDGCNFLGCCIKDDY